MYQITDGTFREAKRYCIHDHVVVEDGRLERLNSCWFNASIRASAEPRGRADCRTAGSQRHAHAGTPAAPSATLRQSRIWPPSSISVERERARLRRRGFRLTPGQRCGDHDVAGYLADVNALKRQFLRLAATA